MTDRDTDSRFGECSSYTASASSVPLLDVQYKRDNLGRIISKIETGVGRPATGDAYEYGYDVAGRLETQKRG